MKRYIVKYSKRDTVSSDWVNDLTIEIDAENDARAESETPEAVRRKSLVPPYQVLVESITRYVKHGVTR